MATYKRCPGCDGIGTLESGKACPVCEGHGGFWIVFGPGMRINVIPGDADDEPEEPP